MSADRHIEFEGKPEHQRRYRRLVDSNLIGVVIANIDGRITDANDCFLGVVGYTREELEAGRLRWDAMTPPEWADGDRRAIEELRANGICTPLEKEYFHKDGRRIPIRATTMLLEGGAGEYTCLIEDLTERTQAEASRRTSESNYRTLVESAADGILVTAAEGRIEDMNEAGCRMLGYSREELLMMSATDLVDSDEVPRVALEIARLNAGEVIRSEWQFRRKDATLFTVEADATVLPDGRLLAILRDITDRRRSDAALRESQTRTQLLVKASHIGLWDWNLVTNDLFCSPEWKQQLGYADHELPSRYAEWESRLHPDDREPTLTAVTDFRKGRSSSYEVQFRLRHRDGSWRWIFTHADMLRDAAGMPVRMMGCHVDVTDQRRAGDERRQVFERISDAFVALDRNWVYTFVNERAAALFGRRPSELIGRHIWTEFPEGVGQVFDVAYRKAMADQEPVLLEAFYPPWDKWFENRIYPSAEGLTIYFHDVTERKRTEEALAASEARLRTIIENQPECVKLVSANGELLEMNPAGLAMLEADSLDDVRGARFLALVADEHRGAFAQLHRGVMRGESGSLVFEVIGLKGTRRWLETQAVPFHDPARREPLLLGLTRDITARKLAEEDLGRSREELRALAARLNLIREEEAKRIARELHDELGQRLTALNMDLLHLEAQLPETTIDARQQWQRVHDLINHTIDVVQKLSSELRIGHLEILGLAAAVEWQVQEFERSSGLVCVAHLPDQVSGVSDTQGTALLRVLQEALTNVVRHARARTVSVSLDQEHDQLTLEIRDDGRGIAADEASARNALGLLGMRERALAIGADITIAGSTGRGTTVRMNLPLPGSAPAG